MANRLRKIYISKSTANSHLTKIVLSKNKNVPVEWIEGNTVENPDARFSSDPIGAGKHFLFITNKEGRFLKKCPGTGNVLCCNYYIVDFACNCDMDCSYCFLQQYTNSNMLILYANTDKLLEEINEAAIAHKGHPIRIGTGEFTDSLSLDYMTEFSKLLVPKFAGRSDVILELKTKSTEIDNLLTMPGEKNIIISWSVNPQSIIEREEHKTASLDDRISSANKCLQAGYSTAFHFDPILHFQGWQEEYQEVIVRIFKTIPESRISWISLGTLRFTPMLKPVIERRFPKSHLLSGELVLMEDGKIRYPRKIRENIFKNMTTMIRRQSKSVPIYLCMEPPLVWKNVFNALPKEDNRLRGIF